MTIKDGDKVIAPNSGYFGYLTEGKEYEVIDTKDGFGFWIKDDTGHNIFCILNGCAHIQYADWIVASINAIDEINKLK